MTIVLLSDCHRLTVLPKAYQTLHYGDTTLSPQGVPRVVTSRSLDLQHGGLSSFISSKKEVKIENLEHAIDKLKYESESSEPSSNNDTKRLREFLESINDFE